MQTFVPLATTDFIQIAKTLDNKRLNKQALEGWQILMTLLELDPLGNDRIPKGWANHPAVKMWRGSETLLMNYVVAMGVEWVSRGYKNHHPCQGSGDMVSRRATRSSQQDSSGSSMDG